MRARNVMSALTFAVVLSMCATTRLQPQATTTSDSQPATLALPVGSPLENYLRYAQTLGQAPLTAWTIRPLTPRIVDIVTDSLPRGAAFSRDARHTGSLGWQILPATASLWYNTSYPFGWNDGAVWRGRGATAAIDLGIAARWKAFSAMLAPIAFFTENRPFSLMPVPQLPENPFADPMGLANIDRPQRFGDKHYEQFNGGQSTIRIDGLGLTAGVSTANQWIGPMSEWPYLLSNNAAGFPHLFAGSSRPWNVGIGHIHGRIFYGGLTQSAFMPNPDTIRGRFITGVMGSFSPTVLPGLEIGGGRIFEYRWPPTGLGWPDYRKPFETFLKEHVKPDAGLADNQSADNQLASVFARWVFPRSGVEVYGELGREDHNWNGRDAILEPEHAATYGLGLRKAWLGAGGRVTGIRGELFNMDPSTLARARPQGLWYGHTYTRQGHTEMGQVLGAGFAAIFGSGATLMVERMSTNGEASSVSLTRMVMREVPTPRAVDSQLALAADRTRLIGSARFTYGVTAVYNINRYFVSDVGNVMTTMAVAW